MLVLKDILKNYGSKDNTVNALKGISLNFRKSEFVSILGQSGCGKTTLLNIVGGLDQYTSGDLVINGKSTKKFTDGDWDAYRNHSIGFVFQSYNLIMHQSILANVELALTLSGVSKAERRKRAIDALSKVGLAGQMKKKPNQLSGGQMQRVAIARAIVNNPDILLADEPTGALDSETSVQIMEILKEISEDRLIVMVTHNPELAEKYSTRIIKLFDGRVTDDSNPYSDSDAEADTKAEEAEKTEKAKSNGGKKKKRKKNERLKSMSIFTALSLSLNNLMTKKARTFLTSFAGSIGIIGIALILSLSSGVNAYIDRVQEETLSTYPIQLRAEAVDISNLLTTLMGTAKQDAEEIAARDEKTIYSNVVMYDMFNSLINYKTTENNLKDFSKYLEEHRSELDEYINAITYTYNMELNIFASDTSNGVNKLNPSTLTTDAYGENGMDMSSFSGGTESSMSSMFSSSSYELDVWEELIPDKNGEGISDLIKSQYEIVDGVWPTEWNELVLVVNENNELSDYVLYLIGLKPQDEYYDVISSVMRGEEIDSEIESWTSKELLDYTFKLVLPTDYYKKENGEWVDMSENETYMKYIVDNSPELKIVGIIRPTEDAVSASLSGAIGYTNKLTDYVIEKVNSTEIVKEQKENTVTDILTSLPFSTGKSDDMTEAEKAEKLVSTIKGLSEKKKAELFMAVSTEVKPEEYADTVEQYMAAFTDRATAEAQMIQSYSESAGMDADTIRGYLSALSDEELFELLRQSIEENVKAQYTAAKEEQLASMTDADKAASLDAAVEAMTEAEKAAYYDAQSEKLVSPSTYEKNLITLGAVDKNDPSGINIYSVSFEAKDKVAEFISEYNNGVDDENKISYTDYIKILISSVTTIINAIGYILIAFVAISLVVSSIMIGIITYISVLERTKEIGILRSIGASKRDISRVFNAETLIVGFSAGAIGILVTLLLLIPANIIIEHYTDIANLAILPVNGAVALVIISMVLTIVAGFIPSKLAAKKDPVVALRTE